MFSNDNVVDFVSTVSFIIFFIPHYMREMIVQCPHIYTMFIFYFLQWYREGNQR